MDAGEFTARLGTLTASDINAVAQALRHDLGTADGELAWWRATLSINGTLRKMHCSRLAGMAGHNASAAVMRAAALGGALVADRDAVTLVARAASDAARALLAGSNADPLLSPWSALKVLAA